MLAIATTLVSLGTDPVNASPVPGGQANTAVASFATTFAEGSALAGEVQGVGAGSKMSKDTADDGNAAFAKTEAAAAALVGMHARANGGIREVAQDGPQVAKILITAVKAKAVAQVAMGIEGKAIGVEAHPQGGKANDNAIVGIQTGVSEGQPSSGSVKEVMPEPVSDPIDASKTVGTDEMTIPQRDIAASTMPTNSDCDDKPLIRNQGRILIAEKSLEMPTDKAVKDHIVAAKAGKAEKIEKTDKAAGPAEKVGNVGPQATAAILIMVYPPNGPTPETSGTPDENSITSIASTELKSRVGTAAVADSNAGKKHAGTDKPNAGEIKAQGFSSPECPSSQKPETDEGKNKGSAAATTAGGDSKGLSAAAINLVTVPKHSDGIASIAASATGAGVGAVATPAVGIQSLVSPHTRTVQSGVAMQSGASAIDARTSIDAAPRTLSATPTSLEVGVASGSHGWLKIRAEMGDGGVVNASLSTASSSGQESLHRELPSLAAYLQNEHVAVNAIVVQPVVMAATDPRGFSDGMNGDGRGQPQQSGGQGGDNRDAANTKMNLMENSIPYNGLSGIASSEQLPLMPYARGGNWLSVRA